MAFKMKPTGGKKDPYSSFHRRGLLTPVKQGTTLDEATINAKKEAAQNLNTAEEKLMKEYYDESTNENVKLYKKRGKGGDGTGIPYAEAYKIAGEKGYLNPNETLEEYTARAKAESTREVRTSNGETDSNPDIDKNSQKKGDGVIDKNTGTKLSTNQVWKGDMREEYDPTTGRSKWVKVYIDAQVNEFADAKNAWHKNTYSSTGDENTVENSRQELLNASVKNSALINNEETTIVKQSSPVRQLMNKYMPKKSMAQQALLYPNVDNFNDNLNSNKTEDVKKNNSLVGVVKNKKDKRKNKKFLKKHRKSMAQQEEVVGDDGKPIKGPIGDTALVNYVKSADKGGWTDTRTKDKKGEDHVYVFPEKSFAKQGKEKKITNYKFKDGETGVSSESKVNRPFRPNKHKIKA